MSDTGVADDVTCGVFGKLGDLAARSLTRFVVGEDRSPRPFSGDEARAELGDPFARLLLLEGTFPRTGEEVLARLAEAAPVGDPLRETPRSFVLGEGSQLGGDAAVANGVRFVVATDGPRGPDVLISTPSPVGGFVELMAWDRESGGFNYYRTVGDEGAWVFAGNSRHALSDPTQGKGPFESHPSGALLMKELEIPWTHWHSFEIAIEPSVFAPGDPVATHPWFTDVGAGDGGLRQGAEVLEIEVAIPSMERWAEARFASVIDEGGQFTDPRRVMVQVLGTPTVNLISTRMRSVAGQPDSARQALPSSFFFSANALTNPPIGLARAQRLGLPLDHYQQSLATFAFSVEDGNGVRQPGDTTFAFFVPERAREDDVALRAAIEVGLITPRLAASLLMVDFPNPIFSARREALLAHVPDTATVTDGASTFSQEMADAVLAAAPDTPDGSPEREFAERWHVGEQFQEPFDALLTPYFAAVAERLQTAEGFDDYVRLAESRRNVVRTMPIFESRLLFPTTNIEDRQREMRPDGTVVEL